MKAKAGKIITVAMPYAEWSAILSLIAGFKLTDEGRRKLTDGTNAIVDELNR